MQATLTYACPFRTESATTRGNKRVDQCSATKHRLVARMAAVIGFTAAGVALAPMGAAFADDDGPSSPATPVIRSADRGAAVAGASEVRSGTQLQDAHGNYVAIQGGDVSAGAWIPVHDGNQGELPTVGGEAGVICSAGQSFSSAMIPCFG